MAWLDINPSLKSIKPSLSPVLFSVSKKSKQARGFCVTVRSTFLPAPIAWWVPGASVRAMLGSGDDAGMIQFVPGGPFKLYAPPHTDGSITSIRFPVPAWVSAGQHGRWPVEFDFGENWLQMTLPKDAMVATAPAAAPAPAAISPGWTTPNGVHNRVALSPAGAAIATPAVLPAVIVAKDGSGVFRTVATVGKGPRPTTGGR